MIGVRESSIFLGVENLKSLVRILDFGL